MTMLRELRNKLTVFYGTHAQLILIIFKIGLALMTFLGLRAAIGNGSIFSNIFLVLILSLLCGILPLQGLPILAAVYMAGCSFMMGYDAGAVTTLVLLVLALLFLRFAPDASILLVLVPAALWIGMPAAVPVCAALKKKPSALTALGSGVVVYYLLRTLHDFPVTYADTTASDLTTRLQGLTGGVFGQTEMVINLIALIAVFVLTYAIRCLAVEKAWLIAVLAGSVFYAVVLLAGTFFGGMILPLLVLLLGTAASIIIGLVFVLIFYDLDYRSTENLRFEDDDYYYYVKAVPKNTARRISTPSGGSSSTDALQEALEKEIDP